MGFRDFGKIINLATAESTVSNYYDIGQETNISIHVVNGAITGTLYLEASDSNSVPGVVIPEAAFDALAGSADSQIMNITNLNSRYVRVGYTHTSGTGKLIIFMTAKAGDR